MHDIPEEAVKAAATALANYIGHGMTEKCVDKAKIAITAALPFLPVQGAVKKLEWEYVERAVMTYVTSDDRGMLYYINQSFGSDSYYFATVRYSDGTVLYDGDDLTSAKAAAQDDYEARIRSALEPSAARAQALDIETIKGALADLIGHAKWVDVNFDISYAHLHEAETVFSALSSPDHADAGKVEGDGWRPIESAPKDGTIVLLGWNDPDIEEIGAVAGWYEGGPADKCWYDQYREPVTATHWMPLRPLPSAPASEGAE